MQYPSLPNRPIAFVNSDQSEGMSKKSCTFILPICRRGTPHITWTYEAHSWLTDRVTRIPIVRAFKKTYEPPITTKPMRCRRAKFGSSRPHQYCQMKNSQSSTQRMVSTVTTEQASTLWNYMQWPVPDMTYPSPGQRCWRFHWSLSSASCPKADFADELMDAQYVYRYPSILPLCSLRIGTLNVNWAMYQPINQRLQRFPTPHGRC